jgi:glutamate-1-semialdehyde aminotransferase
VAFVSTAHTPEHVERAAAALEQALEAVQPELAK